MAALIELTEDQVDSDDRLEEGILTDWARLDPGQEPFLARRIVGAAWERVEARIPNRYVPRGFTAIIRADEAGELYQIPLKPVTLTAVELFDAEAGAYAAQSALKAGPLDASFVLPLCDVWRLTGSAGPATEVAAPGAIEQAVLRLANYAFERRGEYDDHRGFHDSGATARRFISKRYQRGEPAHMSMPWPWMFEHQMKTLT